MLTGEKVLRMMMMMMRKESLHRVGEWIVEWIMEWIVMLKESSKKIKWICWVKMGVSVEMVL